MRALCLLLLVGFAVPAGAASLRAGEIVWAPQGGPLLRVDPATGVSSPLYEGSFIPRAGVVVDAGGSILFVAQSDEAGEPPFALVRLQPRSGALEVVSAGGLLDGGVFDVALTPDGMLFVGHSGLGVVRIDPLSGIQDLLSPFPAFGIGAGRDGALWVGDFGRTLVRLDPASGAELARYDVVECASDAFFRLLAVDDDSVLVNCSVAAGGGSGESAVLRVDAATGAVAVVSQGGLLLDPYGIAREADGSLLVADSGLILRIDPDTGAQQILADGPVGAGGVAVRHAACDDGFDNDGDGASDAADRHCRSLVDDTEERPTGAGLLAFVASAVEEGSLIGSGRPRAAPKRLRAFRNLLRAAVGFSDAGFDSLGCRALLSAQQRTDGRPSPKESVAGPAAPELAARIDELRAELACRP